MWSRPSQLGRWSYAVAVVAVAISFGLKLSFGSYLTPPVMLAILAVFLSAAVGGLGPGLLATALSIPVAAYLVLQPTGSFLIDSPGDFFSLMMFAFVCTFISIGAGEYHATRAKLLAKVGQLEQSESYARGLLEASLDPLATISKDGKITDVNRATEQVTGVARAQLVGTDFADYFTDPEKARAGYREVLDRGTVRDYPLTIRSATGATTEVLYNATVYGSPGGALQGVFAAARDVTEQRHADATRRLLMTAIEQAAEIVEITDARGLISYVNPAFELATGYTREEVLGRNPRVLRSGVHDAAFYGALWDTISGGATWHGRFVNKRKDGKHFTEDAVISPVRDAAGVITSYVAVKRDITGDLAMEDQLRQSQKMEGIGRLAGGVAHDFNNILSVVLGCSGFVLDRLGEDDPNRGDVQEIEKAGRRAAALTRQLLAFSRRQVLLPVPLDLNQVVAEVEKMLRRTIGEDIELVQSLAPDLGPTRVDPSQIEQVMLNLAINARDAMPRGGKLVIETANVELDEEYAGGHEGSHAGPHVMLAMTDSGVGMDEGTQARIFEPFFTTKEVGKGTGLGLSTVYGIVKQSGGSIYVYSEPGKGSTFKVYLPRAPSLETLPIPATRPVTRSAGGETILVVEDDEAVRSLAQRILGGAGYVVKTAGNGAEALAWCQQHLEEVQLVLTDVVMPQMGGRVFGERLLELKPGVKLLYMSGYTDDAIVHHGILDQGLQFIGKPLTQGELLQKVRDVLDGGGTRSP